MFNKEKKCMTAISQYCGNRVDYVQGGGGNASYKLDDKLMAIKASGFSLADVQDEQGYVTVDYAKIKSDYATLRKKTGVDIEAETLKINLESISLLEGMENLRPSVEVGFHAYLARAVIHTHSVQSNMLCCSENGRELAKTIFDGSDLGYVYIPFINPGFRLSKHVEVECEKYIAQNGKRPELIFMESHGMIASDDDYTRAIEFHEEANIMINDYFKLVDFPVPSVEKCGEDFVSTTPFVTQFIKDFGADEKYFEDTLLYPDQMVYQGDNLGKTILIDVDKGQITYKMSENQAKTVEEVLLGVMYIISEIKRTGLDLKLLCDEGVDFIQNWESEKYRASLVK